MLVTEEEDFMKHVLIAAALLGAAGCVSTGSSYLPGGATYTLNQDEVTIRSILIAQEAAWNRGDIDGFMEGSWESDKLRYASGGEVTYGYDATTARYKERYSDRSLMGELDFSDLDIEMLGPDAAVVHGAWKLMRETDEPSGLFTLIFRKIDGEWVMTSDTTTSAG